MMQKTWTFIKGRQFFPHYCKIVYNSFIKQKMNGKGGNGRPITFTIKELKVIRKGVIKMHDDIIKEIDLSLQQASEKGVK